MEMTERNFYGLHKFHEGQQQIQEHLFSYVLGYFASYKCANPCKVFLRIHIYLSAMRALLT